MRSLADRLNGLTTIRGIANGVPVEDSKAVGYDLVKKQESTEDSS